jgi:hypothetical protein
MGEVLTSPPGNSQQSKKKIIYQANGIIIEEEI